MFKPFYILAIITLVVFSQCNNVKNTNKITSKFVGSQTCIECHLTEYNLWKNSDHDNAMDTAVASTVLGDFNDTEFERDGFTSRFFIKDGKYFVHTQGLGGVPGDFQIVYTFGVRPLQQYLIPFENGRYQCLQITWDTEKKQWYHLADSVYKDMKIMPDDWLYWTNNAQNWNGMCAECHSTNLQKNYNPQTHVYNTTWSEIDVSCEACHGPSSEHNKWANIDSLNRPKTDNYKLVIKTSNITSSQLVNQCAYCHSRRSSFGDFVHPHNEVFNIMSPQLPLEPYYYADGQIREEDYVYGSFTQSKMHQNNVRCTNCHNPHSLNLIYKGNKLCYQCHNQEDYGNYNHHFHKDFREVGEPIILENGNITIPVGEGAQCINCHMPGQYFMGVDYRRDHSMRIPRPDLSDKLGTPNACTQCHTNKTNQWATEYTKKWYGKPTQFHFGETMHLANNANTAAIPMLFNVINDNNSSALIKASATNYLSVFPTEKTQIFNKQLLKSNEPLIRREAIKNFIPADIEDLKTALLPLLNDSTLMVRMEAVSKLSVINNTELDCVTANKLNAAIQEYIKTMEYSADFSGSRHNLGNLYSNLGENEKAIANYKEAIRIDSKFFPSSINLAMLYNKLGKNTEAEKLFTKVLDNNPNMGDVYYSLGLLQSEMGNYNKSIISLQKAAELLPNRARIWFNLFNLLVFENENVAAKQALNMCLKLEPTNLQYLYANLEFLLKLKQNKEAVIVAKTILEHYPNSPDKAKLVNFIEINK